MTYQQQLCVAFLDPLTTALQRCSPDADPATWTSAAIDALVAYCAAPERYDADRAELPAYLLGIARHKLSHLLAAESRQRRARESVELDQLAGNTPQEDPPLLRLVRAEDFAADRALIGRVRNEATDDERAVLDLMLAGERATRAYALVLGIADLPEDEQERHVKRNKDRLKKRILRGGVAHD